MDLRLRAIWDSSQVLKVQHSFQDNIQHLCVQFPIILKLIFLKRRKKKEGHICNPGLWLCLRGVSIQLLYSLPRGPTPGKGGS